MSRPRKNIDGVNMNMEDNRNRTVKKTVDVDYTTDRYLKLSAALEGLSDTAYICKCIQESITDEVKAMVNKQLKEEAKAIAEAKAETKAKAE